MRSCSKCASARYFLKTKKQNKKKQKQNNKKKTKNKNKRQKTKEIVSSVVSNTHIHEHTLRLSEYMYTSKSISFDYI